MWRQRLGLAWHWVSTLNTMYAMLSYAGTFGGPVLLGALIGLGSANVAAGIAAGAVLIIIEVVVLVAWVLLKKEPVDLLDAEAVTREVVVRSHLDGDRVTSPFTIRGRAITFEKNVVVQRHIEDDRWELVAGPVTANGGRVDEPGYFEVEVHLPPGRHYLRVGNGPPTSEIPFRGQELWVEVV